MNYKRILFLILTSFCFSTGIQAQTCSNNLEPSSLTSRFTLNGNGTATDNDTGLVWMRCSLGQSWDGDTCIEEAADLNWKLALESAEVHSFAGNADWRLPNLKELKSITESACYFPAINETIFPSLSDGYSNTFYWSSTPEIYINRHFDVWGVNFSSGSHSTKSKNLTARVRLVRNGE